MKNNDRIIYRNPNLIISRIDDSFFSVTNPFINDGTKILNKAQMTILDIIGSQETIQTIARITKRLENDISLLMEILEEKQFVSNENSFQEPHWTKIPNSLNLWIQTTNDCNLRCSYCYIHTLGRREYLNENCIDRFIDKLVETAKQSNLRLVQLRFAVGEPFLKLSLWVSKIPELKQRLDDVRCRLNTVFLTNLATLNQNQIEFIKTNSIGLAVSIDGIGEFHNRTRHFRNGEGSFNIVSSNIERLLDNGIYPTLMTVVSNSNIDGINEFTEYAIEKNLKHRYSFVSGEDIDIQKLILKMNICYELYDKAIEKGYAFSTLHKLCDLKFDNLSFQTCSNGFNGGALYTDGGVYFCQRHFGLTQPLGSIYEEDDLLSIIQRKTFYGEVSPDCKSCIYRYMCTSGCPIERKNKKDPHCLAYKELIPTILRLRGKERLIKIKQILK